ncbi:MAG: hypothetical protein GKR93_07685 [Gammaproteobacteria bacterium]|nr:hypothetical protein [Gammaproteobacteria bacterium]
MNKFSDLAHAASIELDVSACVAFDFLSDPMQLGKWALGCRDVRKKKDDYSGFSIFTGEQSDFNISASRELLLIDYLLGEPGNFRPRISARIVDSATYGAKEGHCLVTLLAWRGKDMTDERWHQLCVCHETEVFLLKGLLEADATKVP